jgi:hypothetical protein
MKKMLLTTLAALACFTVCADFELPDNLADFKFPADFVPPPPPHHVERFQTIIHIIKNTLKKPLNYYSITHFA